VNIISHIQKRNILTNKVTARFK